MSENQQHICFAPGNYYPAVGGLAIAAERVVNFLVSAGFSVHVVVPVLGSPLTSIPTPEQRGGYLIYRIPVGDQLDANQGRAFSSAVFQLDQEYQYTLFHAFWFSLAFPLSMVAMKGKRPLIASIRGTDAYEWTQPDKKRFTHQILRSLSCLTSMNSALLNRITEVGGLSGRTVLIPNSIVPASYPYWELGEHNRGVIGTVGKFRIQKSIPDLLKTYAQLPSLLRKKLLMVGDFSEADQSYEAEAKALVEKLKIGAEIEWTGLVPPKDISSYLKQMHLFVLTSISEGFPNAMLEAASLGVPIVSTRFPGCEDYLVHEENALLAPVGDIRSLSDHIQRVLSDPQLTIRLSGGARKLAANLSPEHEKNAWLSLYQELLVSPVQKPLV